MSNRRQFRPAGVSASVASPSGEQDSEGIPGGRHLGRARAARGLMVVAFTLSAVLVALVGFVAIQLFRLQANVDTQPLNLGSGQESALPVDLSTDPVQILILGTDTRTGNGGESDGGEDLPPGGGNSDVMMLMNLSADREDVTVLSFPRDLLVPLPSCKPPGGGKSSPAVDLGQLNGALASGGPGCTVAAINNLTGLSIDHFMMADFDAVKELSETLGGVEVCVSEPIEDEYSGLSLPAGTSEVEGEQALAFLRTRHSFGDGGDAGRIKAQQAFLASMARKVQAEETLTNLPRLYSIAETITRNLTVDDGLSQVTALLKLADRVKDVDLGNMAFVTVPTEPWELDPNRLVLDEEAAEPLFAAMREDRSLTEPSRAPSPSQSGGSASDEAEVPAPAPEPPAIDAAAVPVTVVNGSGSVARGTRVQALLVAEGYESAQTLETVGAPVTQVYFGAGFDTAAAEIAALFGVDGTQLIPSPSAVGVEVLVGTDFLTGATVTPDPLGGQLQGQTAEEEVCQQASGF
ncbi:LCP family protein [Arthrobacter sp. H41]|uniref:LCP family protein n=1 Tax=Arthrobacter sp. H41 TaxID=1312978 RepID=UPI00047E4E14|nr:LCP family protein [Arthrobacter sp. H41]